MALDVVATSLHRIYGDVAVKRHWFARPYVRTVLSAPTCKIKFVGAR
jgi:hypothetical protein